MFRRAKCSQIVSGAKIRRPGNVKAEWAVLIYITMYRFLSAFTSQASIAACAMTQATMTAILLCIACGAQTQAKLSCGFVTRDVGVQRVCIALEDCEKVSGACVQARAQALQHQDKKPKYSCPSSYSSALTDTAMWVERSDGLYCISVPQTCEESDSAEKCFDVATRDIEHAVQSHSCQPSGFAGNGSCAPRRP